MLLLFRNFEINGSRDAWQNDALHEAVQRCGDLAVLPGSQALADLERSASGQANPWEHLETAAGKLTDYDVMLLDCPPHWGMLTRGAMCLTQVVKTWVVRRFQPGQTGNA